MDVNASLLLNNTDDFPQAIRYAPLPYLVHLTSLKPSKGLKFCTIEKCAWDTKLQSTFREST